MKKLFNTALVLVVILVLLAGTIFVSGLFGKENIKEIIVRQAENYLVSELDFEQARFRLFRKFPQASVELTNLLIKAPSRDAAGNPVYWKTDTLLSARKAFLQMNLADLLKKSYLVSEIDLETALVHLETDRDGNNNFRVWKKTGEKESAGTAFEIKKLVFSRTVFRFIQHKADLSLELGSGFLKMKISSGAGETAIIANPDLVVHRFSAGQTTLPIPFTLSGNLSLEIRDGKYLLNPGKYHLSGLPVIVRGEYDNTKGSLGLKCEGNNLDIKSILNILPDNLQKNIRINLSKGMADLSAGLLKENRESRLLVSADFSVKDTEIRVKKKMSAIRDMEITGHFSNGTDRSREDTKLDLVIGNARPGKGNLQGSLSVRGHGKAVLTGALTGELVLDELVDLINDPALEAMQGLARLNIKFSGPFSPGGKIRPSSFRGLQVTGNLSLRNAGLVHKKIPYNLETVHGDLMFAEHLWFDKLEVSLPGNRFVLNGKIHNAFPFLTGKEKILDVSGDVWSAQFLPGMLAASNSRRDTLNNWKRSFPDWLRLDMQFTFNEVVYKEFTARNMRGHLGYLPSLYLLHNLGFEGMNGRMQVQASAWTDDRDRLVTNVQSILEKIGIRELFHSFNNFGQEFILEENLLGSVTGDMSLRIPWDRPGKVSLPEIVAYGNFRINDGELINFDPVLNLSRFVELSELQHIRFSALENEIYIQDQKILIPQMEIRSSAFNISVAGNHGFDNLIDYRVRVLLSEVLFRKARQNKKENDEFGIVEEDGLGNTSLYLSITGRPGDYRIAYDRGAARQALRKRLSDEGRVLKGIIREEFGRNREQPPLREMPDTVAGARFTWPETDTPDTKKEPGAAAKPRFRLSWEEETPVDTAVTKKKR